MTTPSPSLNDQLLDWAQRESPVISRDQLAIREDFVERFPLSRLPTLALDEYVIGRGDHNTYCYWLEQKTQRLGSIKGGGAQKFGVFWSRSDGDYRVNQMFASPEDAMRSILGGITAGAERLQQRDVKGADDATSAAMGFNRYTMRLKPLTLYFPDLLLPITNPDHLRSFLTAIGQEPSGDQAELNVQLLQALKAQGGAAPFDTYGLMRFLYATYPIEVSSGRSAWKISLGEQAEYLPDALRHNVIFIGSAVADLGDVEPQHMAAALTEAGQSSGFEASAVAFAHRMAPGDVVVANRGTKDVVGIGVIESDYLAPGEVDNPLTPDALGSRYPFWAHARQVRWVIRTPLTLPLGLKKLAQSTVTSLPSATLNTILRGYAQNHPDAEVRAALTELEPTILPPPVPADLAQLLDIAKFTRNIILYGPPGTGKTYTARRFAEAFLQAQLSSQPNVPPAAPQFWWQAVALALADLGAASVPDITAHPVIHAFLAGKSNSHVPQTIWQQLLSHTHPDDSSSNTATRTAPYAFTKEGDLWMLTAVGEAAVAELGGTQPVETSADPLAPFLHLVTFHPAFSYEEFVEGLRPTADGGGLRVRDGIFKRVCAAARADPDNRYVLLIDEINRADTARTFGELITLIEDDKRSQTGLTARYEATLPYSDPPGNRLSVPDNVYLIGTMNTADRSITLLDVALRRRFTFVEVPPATEHLGIVDGLALGALLKALNAQIVRVLDRDHAIGHAYLTGTGAMTARELRFRWKHKIVPLLQEYFYADEDQLLTVLGETLYGDAIGRDVLDEQGLIAALKVLASR